MHTRTLFAALALAGTGLMASQAHAWWVGPGNTPTAHSHYQAADARPVVIRGVNFRHNSDMLTHESTLILEVVAKSLKTRPLNKLQVVGHTSDDGNANYNLDLSTRRAKAVRDYLVFLGVPADTLSYSGYGEMYPLTSNLTDAGRKLNRRVELAPVMPASF